MSWLADRDSLKNPRQAGISGYMLLKNEEEFAGRAISSHLPFIDELIIVYNDCSDRTPQIVREWEAKYPEKIKVYEYDPKIFPVGTTEARELDASSEHSLANYVNFALTKTTHRIVLKIDGDHIAMGSRFAKICNYVRNHLKTDEFYPIFGLNLALTSGEIGLYNFYNFSHTFSVDRDKKIGPAPFTSGENPFFYISYDTWYEMDPVEGYEIFRKRGLNKDAAAAHTYCFLHLKGLKASQGTSSWSEQGQDQLRSDWIKNVANVGPEHIASLADMRFYHPRFFLGANWRKDIIENIEGVKLLHQSSRKNSLKNLVRSFLINGLDHWKAISQKFAR